MSLLYIILVLLLLLLSPLAPIALFINAMNSYNAAIKSIEEHPPHLYLPVLGRDMRVRASLNDSKLVLRFSVRDVCSLHIYVARPTWPVEIPGMNKPVPLIQGVFVIAERGPKPSMCQGVNKTIVIGLDKRLLGNFSRILVVVNDKAIELNIPWSHPVKPERPGDVTYPFLDGDAKAKIKWATVYHGKLYACIAITHDGGGDYVDLVNNPPESHIVYFGKPSPVYMYQVGNVMIVEVYLLAVSDIVILQSACCKPIPLAIDLGDWEDPVLLKVYVNGRLAATKVATPDLPPKSCQTCMPFDPS